MPLDIPLPSASVNADPQQYIPLLLSAVEGFLQLKEVWADADYGQAFSYMEQLKVYIVECFGKCSEPMDFQIHQGFSCWDMRLLFGQTLTKTVSTVSPDNGYAEVTPIAQDNAMIVWAVLKAGDYDVEAWVNVGNNYGKISPIVDGNVAGNEIDCYAATASVQRKTGTLTVAEDGLHSVGFQVTSKNASSSNYRFLLMHFNLFTAS